MTNAIAATYDDDQLEYERITFLQTLLGDDDTGALPDGLHANLWHRAGKHSDWPTYWGAAEDCAGRNGRRDVYLGLALAHKPAHDPDHTRVKNETAAGLLALGKDIDLFDLEAHKQDRLPTSAEDVHAYLDAIGLPPTLTLDSGHGRQAFWVFEQPWVFADDADRERAARLAKAWDAHLNRRAEAHGWTLDATGDLARLLRVAGTFNAKRPDAVVPVRLLTRAQRTTPDALAALLGGWDALDATATETVDDSGTNSGSLEPWQEYTEAHPCPVCGGYEALPTGIGKRCWGFLHHNKLVAYCRRPEYAHGLPSHLVGVGLAYTHTLKGRCRCGVAHGAALAFLTVNDPMILSDLVDATLAALGQANDPKLLADAEPQLYVRGGALSWIGRDEHQRPLVKDLTKAALRVEIDRLVEFNTWEMQGSNVKYERVQPPSSVVDGVMDAQSYPLPRLTGIIETPILRPDGVVLTTPGYDPLTGWVYYPPRGAPPFPRVPDHPSDAEIAAAFDLLHEVIWDFPFAAPADRANALGLLVTLVMRAVITGNIPLALIDATKAGTGKGLLSEVCAIIGVGFSVGMMTEATDEDEWRKRVTTELRTGRAFHIIDNVTNPLNNAALESLLTTDEWHDRLLATNREVTIVGAAKGVWAATGNNLTVTGDMPRRCYAIRQETQLVSPELRDPENFLHPELKAWVTGERNRILHALLTVCRAWFDRGKPVKGAPIMGSFQEWARVIWGVLSLDHPRVDPLSGATVNFGACFLSNGKELWEHGDPDAIEWEVFLRELLRIYGASAFTVADLCDQVRIDPLLKVAQDEALGRALPSKLAAWVSRDGLAKAMSAALRKHRGARYGAPMVWLADAGQDAHSQVARWRVMTKTTPAENT